MGKVDTSASLEGSVHSSRGPSASPSPHAELGASSLPRQTGTPQPPFLVLNSSGDQMSLSGN